ncbi:J domain-containing protein [Dyella jejuensis]|uniref:J domain-containing protein n=1 Tax=Dyella jejuensis TaxID=1432009 RepID=A0ABW8JCP7_9GAMM
MANEIDFLHLYRQLRLSPDCDLQEFKQAYRRRVSALHPDRKPQDYVDSRAAQRLQQLNAHYEAAMEFQRLHGRLPGATPVVRGALPDRASRSRHPSPSAPSNAPRRPHVKWLVPIALVAIGILFWGVSAVPPPSNDASDSVAGDNDASLGETSAAPALTLGMSEENVRAIEGDPVMIRDDVWEYGPSWVRFDHDSVVDWYSSPLHSLKTARTRPSAARD